MQVAQLADATPAERGELQSHDALIRVVIDPTDEPRIDRAIDESDRAVVP